MLDKLEMRTEQQLDINNLESTFSGYQIIHKPDTIFRHCFIILRDGKELFTIKTNPLWSNVCQTQIKVNPNNWGTLSNLYNTLSSICDVSKLEITRIDHAVDLPYPLKYIHSGLRVKHKQKSHLFKERENETYKSGNLTGYEIGTKPELYCIYDKRLQSKNIMIGNDPITRIELRQFSKKIKYRHIDDLVNYLIEPPFNNIEFQIINPETSAYPKSQALERILDMDGLYNAYFNLNKSNNFKRDCSKFLIPVNLQETLTCRYRESLGQFLGEEL